MLDFPVVCAHSAASNRSKPFPMKIARLPLAVLLAAAAAVSAAQTPGAEDAPAAGIAESVGSEAGARAVPAVPLRTESFGDIWFKDRLTIGLGVSWSVLTDAERPKDADRRKTFVGYVWKLEDEDQVGVLPELRYWAAPNLRIALSMDRVSGRTRNFNLAKHSDGVVELMGPQLLVEGLYPMCGDTVLLHAGAGVVYDFADFKEVAWWHLGYSSEAAWNEYGRTGKTRQNYFREIRVDDAFGWTLAAGASWRPSPHFELDLSVRHTWIDPDCQFGYNYGARKGFERHSDGDFTLDHLSVALTGSYVF